MVSSSASVLTFKIPMWSQPPLLIFYILPVSTQLDPTVFTRIITMWSLNSIDVV